MDRNGDVCADQYVDSAWADAGAHVVDMQTALACTTQRRVHNATHGRDRSSNWTRLNTGGIHGRAVMTRDNRGAQEQAPYRAALEARAHHAAQSLFRPCASANYLQLLRTVCLQCVLCVHAVLQVSSEPSASALQSAIACNTWQPLAPRPAPKGVQ